MKYNKKFQEILERLDKIEDEECKTLRKEIESLADIYTKKDRRLNKIVSISDKQQKAILELNEELNEYQNNLEQKVQVEILRREKQENLLFEQSRLARIAEMVDAVAHQWIQPLNIMQMNMELLSLEAKKNNGVTSKKINEVKETFLEQTNHLLETLKNFRTFFRPIKEQKPFSLEGATKSILHLIHDDLLKYNIKVELNQDDDFNILGNENEFKHILLNLINNSKYAFLENQIQDRKIIINILKDDKKLEFIDNAGGIKDEILDKLFEMHSSTKDSGGSGIGLYISQQIAYKHNGELIAENINNGAKFTFLHKG